MKKIFTLIAMAAVALSMNAQTWNVSDMTAAVLTDDSYVYNGLTVYSDATNTVTIDGNNKTVDGVAYTQRMKMGGAGAWIDANTPDYRVLAFDVTGACNISFIALSSSSSATDRQIAIKSDQSTTIFTSANLGVDAGTIASQTFEYTGGAATLYMESVSSGVNIYMVEVSYTTAVATSEVAAEVASVEYYNINGVKVANLVSGIYIKKTVYADGSVATEKVNIVE